MKQSYYMFRLFNGTFQDNLIGDDLKQQVIYLMNKLTKFYSKVWNNFYSLHLNCNCKTYIKCMYLFIFSVYADVEDSKLWYFRYMSKYTISATEQIPISSGA